MVFFFFFLALFMNLLIFKIFFFLKLMRFWRSNYELVFLHYFDSLLNFFVLFFWGSIFHQFRLLRKQIETKKKKKTFIFNLILFSDLFSGKKQ